MTLKLFGTDLRGDKLVMKILYMATYSGISGASHSLINIILQMKKKGIEPVLIIPHRGPLEKKLKENNIEYKWITQYYWIVDRDKPKTFKDSFKWILKQTINFIQELRIYYIIKRKKINLVHINAITSSNGYLAAKLSKIPLVWHIREFLEEDLNRDFRNRNKAISKLNKADSIITVSDSVKNKYNRILSNENLIRVYNGVDTSNYIHLKHDIFEKEDIILTLVGRYVPQKGHLEVIYALNKIIKDYKKVIKIKVYGDDRDKTFLNELKSIVEKLELDEYIDFMGYRSDIHNVWAETDIALVTSKAEAFGRVTIEAMLAGALVIGADTAGTAELISNKYGLLYKQGDYSSLAEKIIFVINNKEEMKEVALLSRNYALENFTATENADNIYQVYRKLLN